MKVLYLYSGARKSKFHGRIGIDYPDTQFYGLNHLGKLGVRVEFKEWQDVTKSLFWDKFLDFRIKHLLLYPFTKGQDIVFGSSLLYSMLLKKIFKTKTKFVLLNIEITRTLLANRDNKIKTFFINWLLKEFDGIVCLTKFQKKYLEDNYPRLRGKIFFVPLGVDTHYYSPNYEQRSSYILSVGRDNGRDYQTVIATARLMPEREFQLVCSKRNLVGISDLPKNVKIFFDLPISELHKKYQEAGLLLLITHNDSFENGADCSGQTVLLDAMANGLPVIVSRKKYLIDYVTDKREAIFVEPYNPVNIKTGIESLNDVELAQEISKRARQRAEKEFSTEKMAKNLKTVFVNI